ncbi:MAG: TetR/AcrR family transcriptional regulator [Alphaproteobacteria bacterium]|nr:TetR/AcrR family transcriptional regulator [Alphaproteobacteria bacterium]MCZ6742765.1 TetR/AcrR family transcriptional regulator [Alphaproteobacteria bacterium]
MGRRSDHSREELGALALDAARRIVEQEGLRGLTARRVARDIGYTIGTIYNHFENLDDLIMQMNGQTLDALYAALTERPLDGGPEKALRSLMDGYLAFTSRHPKFWAALIEFQPAEGQGLPDWHGEKILRLLGLIERALAPLLAHSTEAQRLHRARVIWSSLHGICSQEASGKIAATESAAAMADTLLTYLLAGLKAEAAGVASTV